MKAYIKPQSIVIKVDTSVLLANSNPGLNDRPGGPQLSGRRDFEDDDFEDYNEMQDTYNFGYK